MREPWSPGEAAKTLSSPITERRLQDRNQTASFTQEGLRLRSILEGISEMVFAVDHEWRYTYFNQKAREQIRALGNCPEKLIGEVLWATLPRPLVEDDLRKVMESRVGRVQKYYAPLLGEWIENRILPLPDGGLVSLQQYVTERKRAEEALRRSDERYRTLFHSIDDGFCILQMLFDANDVPIDYRFLETNPAFEKHTGLKNSWGKTVRELVPNLGESWYKIYGDVALSGESVRFENYEPALKRWFDVYAFRVDRPQDRRVALLFKDITERKQAVQALREANRRKDEFLAVLAHELRNPMTPIFTGVQLLLRADTLEPKFERTLEMLERQVKHMNRLLDDLLDVSRIAHGKIELRKEPVELASVIQSAIDTSKPLIESANHRLSVTLPPHRIVLDADPVRLVQVFSNLLNNGATRTEAGGHIWLTAEQEDGWVVVSFCDTGAGIPIDVLPHIFDMFVQVGGSSDLSQAGLGIGLTLVRSLTEMHGGSVEAYSDGPGKGSQFIVRLPVATSEHAEASQSTACQSPLIASSRILVVDDNRDLADSIGMLFEAIGAQAQVVYDGQSALNSIETYKPAMVLMDIGMPGMDGYEVARRIRADSEWQGVKLVALTGWGQAEDRRRARLAGFDHHLTKPVALEELQALLDSLDRSA